MRRKLKFKEKERRKEARQTIRDSKIDFDPLAGHDSAFISQIKTQPAESIKQPQVG
jgi:hypothetical protein